ncbi:MAG: sugar transferase [Actinomycetota bacterium]
MSSRLTDRVDVDGLDEFEAEIFGRPSTLPDPTTRPPWRVVAGAFVLCVVTTLLGAQGSVVAEFLKAKEWQAVAEVEFRDPALLPETVAVSFESPSIWHPVAAAEGISQDEFQKNYESGVAGGTQIIRVSYVDTDPERARRITDAVVANYLERFTNDDFELQADAIEGYIATLSDLEASLVESLEDRDALSVPVQIDRQDQLVRTRQQIAALTLRLADQENEQLERAAVNPRVVSPGFVLEDPVTPDPAKAAVFGAVAGGLIGVLAVYLAFHRTAIAATTFTSGGSRGPGGRGNGTRRAPASPRQVRQPRIGSRFGLALKRLLDIAVSASLLLVGLPMLVLIAVAIRLTSRGPALFRQERVGRSGRPFTIVKFRTMRTGNDDREHRAHVEWQLRARDDDAAQERPDGFKLDDNRVTAVGGLLRRTSIDEIPQLWNVLKGDMSLVGPRPALPWEHDLFGPAYEARTWALPGCSGLWQVSGRSLLSTRQMLDLDLDYVQNWSFGRDLMILLRTPVVLIRGDGAQ